MEGIIVKVLLGFGVAALLVYIVMIYNGLVALRNNIDKSWGNIDVLLKQRHDELPKLVKTCEAYMSYEKKTLEDVIALRNAAAGENRIGAKAEKEGALTSALHRLFALAENYPDLKAQENFQNLQRRISALEDGIADRREFYNDSVNNFNIRIQSVPDLFVARQMGLVPREMFKATEAERRDVAIDIKVPG